MMQLNGIINTDISCLFIIYPPDQTPQFPLCQSKLLHQFHFSLLNFEILNYYSNKFPKREKNLVAVILV